MGKIYLENLSAEGHEEPVHGHLNLFIQSSSSFCLSDGSVYNALE
jgi:hypothetical protein